MKFSHLIMTVICAVGTVWSVDDCVRGAPVFPSERFVFRFLYSIHQKVQWK